MLAMFKRYGLGAVREEVNMGHSADFIHSLYTQENIKPSIRLLWNELQSNEGVVIHDDREDVRADCVSALGIFERELLRLLQEGTVTAALNVSHTVGVIDPIPLMTNVNTKTLDVDPALQACQNREDILRSANLMLCELDAGVRMITLHQQSKAPFMLGHNYYRNLELEFPGQLIRKPVENFPLELTGMTYLLQDADGTISCFSLQAATEEQIQPLTCGLWFGPIVNADGTLCAKENSVVARYRQISAFVAENADMDMMTELANAGQATRMVYRR